MEVRCPGCARPLAIPDELCASSEADDAHTITSVDCPNCGLVSLGAGYHRTIAYQSATEPLEIRQVAHFALVRQLGRGGFGTVWLAHDLTLEREVALKLPASKGGEAASLLHEAQTAASLRHPNIVSIYEVDVHEGRAYIASEYIDGLTLRDFLSAGRPPLRRTVELLMSVAHALHHAHEHGVVHRDVKPANILLNKQGQPFVADFGIAKRISAESTITSEGRVVGTARYMSPEQASGKTRETDRRSDIYAFGVILFEMLTGDTPFRGNVRALLHQKTSEEAPSPRRLDPALPRDLETICLKCLEREPPKRYATAQEVADELARFSNGEPIQARPITSLERVWRRCRRRPVVAALVVSLFLSLSLGLAGVSFFWLKARASAERLERSLYRAQMNVAAGALDNGDIAGVRRALDRFGPQTPLAGLRGFEWYYFQNAAAPIREVANQGDVVEGVAVSRDGHICAACGRDGPIRVWNAETGELIRTLSLDKGHFTSLEFAPTSTQLAAGSSDGMFRIWNPLKNDQPLQANKHGPQVILVRYAASGKRLLTAGASGAVRVWDLEQESIQASLPSGPSGLSDARFSADGEQVAVASQDGMIRIWQVEGMKRLSSLSPNPPITAIAFSDDGQTIVSGGKAGALRIWSVADEKLLHVHQTFWQIGSVEFLKNSRILAVSTAVGSVHLHDIDRHHDVAKLQTHNLSAGVLKRSADGNWLALGSGDGAVKRIELRRALQRDLFWHNQEVRAVAFLPDGKRLAAAGGSLKIWHLETGKSQDLSSDSPLALTAIAVQPHGTLLAAAGGGKRVELWDRETLQQVATLELPSPVAASLGFSPSGRVLAIAVRNGPILLYEGDWTKPRHTIPTRNDGPTALAFTGDESLLVVAFAGGQVRFFDPATGQPQDRTLRVNARPLAICLCEEDRLLAIGTDVGEIHLWDILANRERRVFKGHSGRIASLAAFPGGKAIVSASRDRELKLWDTDSGESLTTLAGHARQVFSVAISPDGHTVASGGLEGDIRLWRSQP